MYHGGAYRPRGLSTMADNQLIILDGCTFFASAGNGDAKGADMQGLFFRDVRHLSHWVVRADGRVVEPLSSRRVDYYSARVVGKPEGSPDARPPLAVRRDRFVSDGTHEEIVVENLGREETDVEVEV